MSSPVPPNETFDRSIPWARLLERDGEGELPGLLRDAHDLPHGAPPALADDGRDRRPRRDMAPTSPFISRIMLLKDIPFLVPPKPNPPPQFPSSISPRITPIRQNPCRISWTWHLRTNPPLFLDQQGWIIYGGEVMLIFQFTLLAYIMRRQGQRCGTREGIREGSTKFVQ